MKLLAYVCTGNNKIHIVEATDLHHAGVVHMEKYGYFPDQIRLKG